MVRAILLTLEKEFRLLRRDRVGLFMLLVAPIPVIAAAGFSLANIYGAAPAAGTNYVIAMVDEDHGEVGAALSDALGKEKSIRVVSAADREQARAMVRRTKRALAAIVVPPGTTRAIERGDQAEFLLYVDPVRYLEIFRVELRLAELCRAITIGAALRARERLAAAQSRLRAELGDVEKSAREARSEFERLGREAGRARAAAEAELRIRLESALAEAQRNAEAALSRALDEAGREIAARANAREAALAPLKRYMAQLQAAQADFGRWFEQLKQMAGGRAGDIPAPPAFPVPPQLEALSPPASAGLDVADLKTRIRAQLKLPPVQVAMPPLAPMPKLPPLPEFKPEDFAGEFVLPGSLGFTEPGETGGRARQGGFNVFDLHVPGFGVTFLLIGMLMGVSLALIDEREWGTLERLRSASAPLAVTLTGKMLSRFLIGFAQLIILFAVGYALFGISLGHAPLALLLPGAAIAFAGASFGLIVAGIAGRRDAVLPVGAIVIMTMAAIGGCWWPIEFEPAWMRALALGVPTTWAMQAFNDLMIRDLPAAAAVTPSAINLGLGLIYALIGIPLARRRFAP